MTAEQQARDMLERMGVEDAQSFTSGDVVELANLIHECEALRLDAKRFRWLTQQNASLHPESWVVTSCDYSDDEGPQRYWVGCDLASAIDSAISEQALQALADEAQAMGLYDMPGDEKR